MLQAPEFGWCAWGGQAGIPVVGAKQLGFAMGFEGS